MWRLFVARFQLDALRPAIADQFHDRADVRRRHIDHQVLDRLHRFAVHFAWLMTRGLPTDSSNPSRRMFSMQDRQVQQAAAGDVEFIAFRLGLGSTRRATFDSSSLISRSRSCRLVTYGAVLADRTANR